MTVSISYSPLSYNGNGSTTAFPVTWPFFTGSLVVTAIDADGVETVKTISTHYTVSGGTGSDGIPGTGTVTMLTAPASGTQLRITRSTSKTQSYDPTLGGSFNPDLVEAAFDKALLIAQELANVNDEFTGDYMALNSAGATNFWDAEDHKIRNVVEGTEDDDAVTKSQLDDAVMGDTAFTQAGTGAVERTWQSKLREVISVKDFGAVGDGQTDDTDAIVAAIAAASALTTQGIGGSGAGISSRAAEVIFPPGIYITSERINITTSNVRLIGAGCGGYHDISPYADAGTILQWNGASGGVMMAVAPEPGASNQRLVGNAVLGIAFVGGPSYSDPDQAGMGLIIASSAFGDYDIATHEFTIGGLVMGLISPATLGESCQCEHNTVRHAFRQQSQSGAGLILTGDATFDCAFNYFTSVAGRFQDGVGIDLVICDNNYFDHVYLQLTGSGSGSAIVFRGGATAAQTARANYINHFSQSIFGGPIVSEGTNTKTVAAEHNYIAHFDAENGTPSVTIGTGSSLYIGVADERTVSATLSASQNNYNPSGLRLASVLRLDGGAADRTITGLVAGQSGQRVNLINVGTTNALVLADESGSSTAANRFALTADLSLAPDESIALVYDHVSARWRPASDCRPANSVTNAKLADMAEATFKMRAASAGTGDPIDGTAAQAKTALAVVSTDIGDFTEAVQDVMGALLADSGDLDWTYTDGSNTLSAVVAGDAITNAKMANMAESTIKGRAAGAGTGDPTDLTSTQATAILDAATDALKGTIEIAVQSEMETGTDATRAVTPGRQHFHASAAKAWLRWQVNGTVDASYNITSVTDNGTGNWSIVIATDFSSANYALSLSGNHLAANAGYFLQQAADNAPVAGSVQVLGKDDGAATLTDPDADRLWAIFFGDQA